MNSLYLPAFIIMKSPATTWKRPVLRFLRSMLSILTGILSIDISIAGYQQVTQFEQYTGSHVGVPSRFTGTYFAQVKANNLLAGFFQFTKEVEHFFCVKSTLYRGAGVRCKAGL